MKFIIAMVFIFSGIPALYAQDKQLMPYPENEKLFIYPKDGQSEEQLQNDKFQCYQKAMKVTGFDPSAIPQGEKAPPGIKDVESGKTPETFDGDYSTPDKNYLAEEAKKDWKTEEINKYEANKAEYNKTYKSCLENFGYTIN
jgi:hypothetical protein